MSRRALGLAAFLGLACALGLAGFWLLFTSFKTYDDEGYVLLSLVNFSHGGRLYREIFSQYGPFFYVWSDALHRALGFEFTNTAGRLLTLAHWLGTAMLCAWIVGARTRSFAWALLALAATFAHLWQMTAEPMHPGGLIVFLVALAAWGSAECIERERSRALALVVGVIGAALVLTKINVGVFLFAGAGAWLALNGSGRVSPRIGAWLAGVALALLPWALMRPLLGQPWVVTFALVVSCAAVSTVLAALPARRQSFPGAGWLWLAGGAAATVAIVAGFMLVRGTGLNDLIEGVVRAPLRQPSVFSFPVLWRPGALALAVLSLAWCAVAPARGWHEHPGFVRAAIFVRLGLLAAAVLGWFARLPVSSMGLAMSYGVPLIWILVVPLARDEASLRTARVRAWLGLLAVTQALHAYPVGGSQIGWGTFLLAPLLVLAGAEAVALLKPQRATRIVAPLAVTVAFGLAAAFASVGWQRWRTSEPLGLPGAEMLRLPELLSARLRTFTLNASVHAGRLFSLPGVFSFNLWSGRPAPTMANVTHWFSLLNAAQQREIAAQLAADPRAVVVVEREVLRFMRDGGLPVAGALHDFLYREFAPVLTAGNYELWCKRGRTIAPLATARLYRRQEAGAEKFQLEVCVLTPPGARIARLEWLDCSDEEHSHLRLVLDAHNCRIELTPLFLNGAATAAPAPAEFPIAPPRLARLAFISSEPLVSLPRRDGVLRLRDADGTLVAEAIFAD